MERSSKICYGVFPLAVSVLLFVVETSRLIPNSLLVQAQVLVDFWLENYKIQVEARSGLLHVDVHGKFITQG